VVQEEGDHPIICLRIFGRGARRAVTERPNR
jgi:hypothetical protein